MSRTLTGELEGVLEVQGSLTQANESLKERLSQAEKEKEQIEQSIALVTSKKEEVDNWILANGEQNEMDFDQVFVPKEPLAKQLLDNISEDLAIDDALYFLDKALSNGKINSATFLQEVRKLSREQFFKKLLVMKIREKLNQRV